MRVLLQETIDPDGALPGWIGRDLTAMGHRVVHLPVQELVVRLGPDVYARLFLDLARWFMPHVAVVHPPYDFLPLHTLRAVQALGTRVVGVAFDDPIMEPGYRGLGGEPGLDLYVTTGPAGSAPGNERVVHLPWAMSRLHGLRGPRLVPTAEPTVCLVGRAYADRVALVRDLARLGVRVVVHGRGWAGPIQEGVDLRGPVPGAELPGLYRRCPVVLCPGGWDDTGTPMIKSRLLEVVAAGGLPAVRRAPGLDELFGEDEVLAYDTVEELAELVTRVHGGALDGLAMAAKAHARFLAEHTWRARWPAVLDALAGVGRPVTGDLPEPQGGPPAGYAAAMASLGLDLEAKGRHDAGLAAIDELLGLDPGLPATWFASGRCMFALGRPKDALVRLRRAWSDSDGLTGPTARGLPLVWPPSEDGRGLGVSGRLDLRSEIRAYMVACHLALDEPEAARDLLRDASAEPDALVATVSLLDPSASGPVGFWRWVRGLVAGARPALLRGMQEEVLARIDSHTSSTAESG